MHANDAALDPSLTRVVGVPGDDVNMWGITQKVRGKWERLSHSDADGTHLRVWPLDELTLEEIRARWGGGEFRMQWFVSEPTHEDPKKRFRPQGTGPAFTLDEPEPVRVAAPASAPTAAPAAVEPAPIPGLGQALQLFALINQQAAAAQRQALDMAATMAGRGNGLDASTLVAILTQQQQNTKELLSTLQAQHDQSMAALRGEIATLRAELDGGDDDDDESTTATVARAAAPIFKAGKPAGEALKAVALNYLAEHPDKAIEALKAIPQALTAIAALAQQQQQHPPPSVAPLPRAMPAAVAPIRPAAVSSPEPSPAPGLNAILSQQPVQTPAAAAPKAEAAAE